MPRHVRWHRVRVGLVIALILIFAGVVTGTLPNPRLYFSSIDSFKFFVFGATFEGGTCGVWRQTIDGNTGDIVC